jgi:DNA-binding IclR family transcriptional regulator
LRFNYLNPKAPPILARHCRKVLGDVAGQISEEVDESNKTTMKTPSRLVIPLLCAAIGIVTLASLAAARWQQYQGHTTDSNRSQTTATYRVRTEHQIHTPVENVR